MGYVASLQVFARAHQPIQTPDQSFQTTILARSTRSTAILARSTAILARAIAQTNPPLPDVRIVVGVG